MVAWSKQPGNHQVKTDQKTRYCLHASTTSFYQDLGITLVRIKAHLDKLSEPGIVDARFIHGKNQNQI